MNKEIPESVMPEEINILACSNQLQATQQQSAPSATDVWKSEVAMACSFSKIGRVTFVRDEKNRMSASIDGDKMKVGDDVLNGCVHIRRYIIGHELGHRKCGHEKIFYAWFVFSTVLAVLSFYLLLNIKFHGVLAVVILFSLMILYSYVKNRAMFLEWQADLAGAEILNVFGEGTGRQSMLDGLAAMHAKREIESPKLKDYYTRFYESKMTNLEGGKAKWWIA